MSILIYAGGHSLACSYMYPPTVHISDIKATENQNVYNIYFTNGSSYDIVEKVQYNIVSKNQTDFNSQLKEKSISDPTFMKGNENYNVTIFENNSSYVWTIENQSNHFLRNLNISIQEDLRYWSFISEKYNSAYLIIPPYLYIAKLGQSEATTIVEVQNWDGGAINSLAINEDLNLLYSVGSCCYCVSKTYYSYSEDNIEFLVKENLWDIVIIEPNTKQLIYASEFDTKINHYQLEEKKSVTIEIELKTQEIENSTDSFNLEIPEILTLGLITIVGSGLGIISAITIERLVKK
ncbi:MAG: hypothetical protein ACW981_09325 [Candidatus Hodarchaeales archaeon]